MQLALQKSMTGVGTNVLHLHQGSAVRLYDYYRQQIADEQARVLVACDTPSQQTVAMGSGRIWLHADYVPGRSGELVDLWVEPEHRRKGLAGRLVLSLLKFFRANRIEFLAVNQVQGNSAAEALWGKLGFQPVLVTATAERRTVEAALDVESRRVVPVRYRSTEARPAYAQISQFG
jgi:GNAT superfamily N-acetyltransferase